MIAILLRLILIILALHSFAFGDENSLQYGTVAGAVYPPFDAVNLTGYVILTPLERIAGDTAFQKAENTPPIYIRRMFKGRILCDSIPAGNYEASINGVAYDSDYKVAATCVEQKLVNFRVAPDSISIFSARLLRKGEDEKITWKLPWPEIMFPDTSETVAIRGLYPNQPIDKIYNNMILKKEGFLFTIEPNLKDSSSVDGLNLAVFSNRFYHGPDNILNVSYNRAGKDIVIALDLIEQRADHVDYHYRQPVYKLTNIPLSPIDDRIMFIYRDTSVFKIEIDSTTVNLEEIKNGEVGLYREPTYTFD